MKIKDCGFTQNNICIAVLSNGSILLCNIDTQKMYEVNVVKVPKFVIEKPKGCKKIHIKELEKIQEYLKNIKNY